MIDIEKAVQAILGGKAFIKIDARWAFKSQYELCDRKTIALVRLRDSIRVAMPHLEVRPSDPEEFKIALTIIKEVNKRSKNGNSKL